MSHSVTSHKFVAALPLSLREAELGSCLCNPSCIKNVATLGDRNFSPGTFVATKLQEKLHHKLYSGTAPWERLSSILLSVTFQATSRLRGSLRAKGNKLFRSSNFVVRFKTFPEENVDNNNHIISKKYRRTWWKVISPISHQNFWM